MAACLECGALFARKNRYQLACRGRCTVAHANRVFRLRREFDRMKASLLPYLTERDGGRCGICRRLVRARTGAGSASIDHIIALNLGGTNDLVNLQLAHRGCNSRKGDRSGSQLLLFG